MASTTHAHDDSRLTLDDRLFPVLITTWEGPATHPLIDALDEWSARQFERATRQKLGIVMIADAREAGLPSAEVRERFAAAPNSPTVLRTIVVTNSKVVRGALTAIRWLMAERYELVSFTDLDAALGCAARILDEAGQPIPAALNDVAAS